MVGFSFRIDEGMEGQPIYGSLPEDSEDKPWLPRPVAGTPCGTKGGCGAKTIYNTQNMGKAKVPAEMAFLFGCERGVFLLLALHQREGDGEDSWTSEGICHCHSMSKIEAYGIPQIS